MSSPLPSFRRAARALWWAFVLIGSAIGFRPALADDPMVELSIDNSSHQALRCMILFGHWITRDLPTIEPGASAKIVIWRGEPLGALYIPRADGRKMMIENVLCGGTVDWSESRDQIPLLPIRNSKANRFNTVCKTESRVRCSEPK
ncbi:MAG: hypothetical protein QOK29_2132 [Rhodospirillaceae bacterium]|jgi:hypothetical protein|nr:hypothetical protein [Rhodospirillaceae bacterium]